jgi:phospho-N-acetylmuramoyl-pentapeptide-transferase
MIQLIVFALIVSLVLSVLVEPIIIPIMHRLKFGQSIRQEGPQSHYKKSGTPTMGGVIFGIVTLLTVMLYFIFFDDLAFNIHRLFLLFFPLIGYGLIGFIDDYLIVVKKNNQGLRPLYKFLMQIVIAGLFFYFYLKQGLSTEIMFNRHLSLDLKWVYGMLIFFMMVGGSNAVNLTDGLDGLAAGLSSFAIATFTYIAFINKQYDIVLFGSSILGCVMGFLVFNAHPAKIFMGDTGSLALGAVLATMAILLKVELLLIIVGGVFVLETVSVILQVLYFKKTKGKRLFKMSPIHHHFELSGMSESQVVLMFYGMGVLCSIISLLMILL